MFSMDTSKCQIPPTRYNNQIIYKKKKLFVIGVLVLIECVYIYINKA